ncbi:MAG: hypothetical protein HC854_03880 [Flavobacterium sp.]|nr:hypothetical protein [Flavobacterium sp.]
MTINPNSGAEISLTEAKSLVNAFRTKFPKEIKASFVGVNNLNLILQQPNCIGVRIYNGYDAILGRFAQVLVGVDATGKDLTNGVIIDRLDPCPSVCDPIVHYTIKSE